MPKYDFECPVHGAFEKDRPITDAGKDVPCPECEQPSPQVIGAPAIHWRNTPKFHP